MQTLRVQRWLESDAYPFNRPRAPVESGAGAGARTPSGSDAESGRTAVAAPDEKKDKDPFLVDWDVDDPAKPQNWSTWKKWAVTLLLAQLCTMVGVASSINSQAVEYAAESYAVSVEVASLDTALFLCGFGAASVFWAPLSELAGRSPIYAVAFTMLVLFEVGAAESNTLYARCIVRFFAGCCATPPLSNAGGGMGDIWTDVERAYAFTCFAMSGFFGPCLGPVLGGWIGQSYLGFKWCDWIQAIWAGLEVAVVLLVLPETFPPQLLKMKAAAIRKRTGDDRYRTALERARGDTPFATAFVESLKRPFKMMFLEPIVQCMCLYLTVVYIILFGDLIAFTYIFQDTWDLSTGMTGTCFLALCVGLIVCACCSPIMYADYRRMVRRTAAAEGRAIAPGEPLPRDAKAPPEARLRTAMLCTWLMPISLFWAAWVDYSSVSIWAQLVAQAVFGFAILTTFVSSYQYLIDAYGNGAASALSAVTFLRYPVAGGSVMFTGPMYASIGTHWALTIFAFISLVASAIPWVFYRFGPKIRSWSKYTPEQ